MLQLAFYSFDRWMRSFDEVFMAIRKPTLNEQESCCKDNCTEDLVVEGAVNLRLSKPVFYKAIN